MEIVDDLCSPGWQKDLTISVLSLDRKFEFKVAISPRSLVSSFWLSRRFGEEDFVVRKTVGPDSEIDVVCRVVISPLVQEFISSIPGLEGRRAPVKCALGEKVVAVINEVGSDPAFGDVSDLISGLADKEIEDFERCNGVRVVGFVVGLSRMTSSSQSMSTKAAYLLVD